jgi:hypothetical protein
LSTNAIPKNEDIKLEPPYDKNGSGVPTTGSRPDIIEILINTCRKIIVATPIQVSLLN